MANTIIRAPQRQRFLVIDQRTVEDTGLSWAARGMLAYLLSRPDAPPKAWCLLADSLEHGGGGPLEVDLADRRCKAAP